MGKDQEIKRWETVREEQELRVTHGQLAAQRLKLFDPSWKSAFAK